MKRFQCNTRPVLCAYLFSPSLLTTSSSFSWPFKSGVFKSSVPDPMSFCFLPLMLSSMFSFLSSALTPLICGCLPHISSWGLSKEFKLSILIHTHTHSWCASQSLHQPTDYHIPLDDNSTCWAAQTRLNYYRLPHQKTLPVLRSKWTLILTSFYCYVLLPTLQFLVQHCKGPCLHYIFREPSSLSTVAKMILHNYVGINFYSLQTPPRCLTHSKWKPNSLLWSYIVYTWLFFHTVSSASFCYLF